MGEWSVDDLERAERLAERAGAPTQSLVPLGRGTDHHAYAAGHLVIRLAGAIEPSTATTLRREAALLELLRTELPVAVPAPTVVAPDLGGLVYPALPGRPLLDVQPSDLTPLVEDLAALLAATAAVDAATLGELVGPDPYALPVWRDEVVEEVLEHRRELLPREVSYIESFARSPAPAEPDPRQAVLCHNDLGAEHLLIDEASGQLVGVLDWSDAALTDPCRDLGRLTRDLGLAAVERIIAGSGLTWEALDRRRIEFHARLAAFEDLAHGIATGDARYLVAARASLPVLFESR